MMGYYRCQSNDGKKSVDLAVGNLGYDEITCQNGKVKTITNYLGNAWPRRVSYSPKFHRHKNGWNHSYGEYTEKNDFGQQEFGSHAQHADQGKRQNQKEQYSDRVVHQINGT